MSMRFLNALALVVLLALVLLGSVVVVPEGERGLLYRFGEPIRIGLPPGRYLRIPLVDRLERVDVRTRLADVGRSEYHDRERVPMLVEAWVLWRVRDLPAYLRGTGADPERAAVMLLPPVQEGLQRAFAAADWQAHRKGLAEGVLPGIARASSRQLRTSLGIEIVEVRIRRLVPPPALRALMLDQMGEQQRLEAARVQAEGTRQAEALRLAGEREREALLRTASLQASALRREAAAQAASRLAEGRRLDPAFHRDWHALENWRRSFGKAGDVLVLGSESELRAYRQESGENTPALGSGVPPR